MKFKHLIEKNGKSIQQNNLNKPHNIPLGTIVHVEFNQTILQDKNVFIKGHANLFVVKHTRDCDGEPLYTLSDIPATPPDSKNPFFLNYHAFATLILNAEPEHALTPTELSADNFYHNFEDFLNLFR